MTERLFSLPLTKVGIHFGHVRMCATPYPISWILFIATRSVALMVEGGKMVCSTLFSGGKCLTVVLTSPYVFSILSII